MNATELPKMVSGRVLTSLSPTRNGCASYEVEGLGWIVRHTTGGWNAIGVDGRLVARDLSYEREAVAALEAHR